jgi:hypothetical protein
MIEYEVIILDPSPYDAAVALNELASMGWEVVGAYYENRIILRREKSWSVCLKPGKPVRVIGTPPEVA